MNAQDQYVHDSLAVMREMQLSLMKPEELLSWLEKIDDVNDGYRLARATENDKSKSDAEQKRAKEVADGIAKAAPGVVKGIIGAQKAFRKGDGITGAAEIMDVCASLAPLLGLVATAAGPIGAALGALFSVVGQILRYFAPAQESDVSKLEKFMKDLKAQTELEDIKAVHDAVLAYSSTLLGQASDLQTLLARPLQTHADFRDFIQGLDAANITLADTNPHSSVAMFKNWEVLEYLKSPDNHDDPLWPSVLGICCKSYSDLVSTAMIITAMANTDDMQARLADVAPDAPGNLSKDDRGQLELKLLGLRAYADARRREYESCNRIMRAALGGLTGVAQRWGLHAHIGTRYSLYFARGPKDVRNGSWTDRSDRNYYHRVVLFPESAAVIRTGQVSAQFDFKPSYHCLVLKSTGSEYPGHHWMDHIWVHPDDVSIDHFHNVRDNVSPALNDVWPTEETGERLELLAGTAEVPGAPGSVMRFTMDGKEHYNNSASLEQVNWWPPTRAAVDSVRAVTAPVAPAGDPDQAALLPGATDRILYASQRGSTDVYVNSDNQDHYVAGPPGWGPCVGLGVDRNYLWYYQPLGFAVASHASVLSHLRGDRPAPRWIGSSLPSALVGERLDLGDGMPRQEKRWTHNRRLVPAKPPLEGLKSLSPCEDGTLLAAVVHRTIEATPVPYQFTQYDVTDTWTIQTATYTIDAAAGTVSTGTWTKIPGEARQIQKLPMPGWTLLESLLAKLH